jgi:hypothetical protein
MFANCQLLLGGSMNAQQAAAATQQTAERIQRTARSEADHFKQWTKDFGA